MRLLLSLATLVFIGSLVTSASAQTPVRVGYLPATHDSLLFVAKELHLFDSERIIVQEKPYDNSVQILSDLKSKLLDIGIPGIATPALEIGGRAPLSIIGGAAAESAALVVQPDLSIEFEKAKGVNSWVSRIKLLKGRKVGAVRGSTGLAILRQALHQADIDEKDVNLRDFQKPSEIISALVGHNLDAGLLWSPHMTLAEDKGFKIAIWMTEVLPHHVCCRQVARDEFLKNDQDAVVAYLVGILRADKVMRQAQTNSDQKARVMTAVKKYLTTLSDRQIEVELFGQNPRTTLTPDIDRQGIDSYLTAMQTANMMRPDQCTKVKDKIQPDFLLRAYRRLGCNQDVAENCVTRRSSECECLR